MRVSNGNVNTSKILNKMCNSQKTSAESLWVNTIEYLTVSSQYGEISVLIVKSVFQHLVQVEEVWEIGTRV